MAFFQRKADELLADYEATNGKSKLMEVCKFNVMANEAAVQLAPYVHSKMPLAKVKLSVLVMYRASGRRTGKNGEHP
jgi:hypothetical protein